MLKTTKSKIFHNQTLMEFPVMPREMFFIEENGQEEITEEVRQASERNYERNYKREVEAYESWRTKNPAQPLATPLELPVLSRTEEKIVFQIPPVKRRIALKNMIFKSQLVKELGFSPYYLAGEVTIKADDIDLNKFSAFDLGVGKAFLQTESLHPPLGATAEFCPTLSELIPQIPYKITIQFFFPPLTNIIELAGYANSEHNDFFIARKWEWQETVRKELCLVIINNLVDIVIGYLVLTMSSFDITMSLIQ